MCMSLTQHAEQRMSRAAWKSSRRIPARHQMYSRSPYGCGVVRRMIGSLPDRVWIQGHGKVVK